jgi:hypothetical protein
VDGLEATLGSSFWFGLPVLVDPGVVSSDGFLSYFTFLLQYMRDVCQKGDNALDFEIKRIQRTIFNSTEPAEQHGVALCKDWTLPLIRDLSVIINVRSVALSLRGMSRVIRCCYQPDRP